MSKKILSLLLATALSVSLFGCRQIDDSTVSGSSSSKSNSSGLSAVSSESLPAKDPVSIKLVAAGDNLIHNGIYDQARARAGSSGYDFNYAYQNVKNLINGDINVLNQETLLVAPTFAPSNYPLFSTPVEVGDLMIEMGFNVFTLANNHMLDKGAKGIQTSLEYFDKQKEKGVITAGQFRNQAELDEIRTITKKDVTVGFVSITEHTNGLSLSAGSDIKILYTSDEEAIEKQIKATKEKSDIVVVAAHWGVENSGIVSDKQKELAQKMVNWGAGLIIGTHPHVLQPMEYLQNPDGDKVLVAYSLGNFISAMNKAPCMLGGLLDLEITKNYAAGKTAVTSVSFVPIVTHFDARYQNIRVYPYEKYTEELANKHGVRTVKGGYSGFNKAYLEKLLYKAIDEEFLKGSTVNTVSN